MYSDLLTLRRRGHAPFPRETGDTCGALATTPANGGFCPPEWARHAIWYQIVPDRFRNGDPGNDPDRVRPWTSDWFELSPWETGGDFYAAAYQRYYGGDLAGIEQQLPYLRALGVNALYLTPIFKATSYHRYNAVNYVHVDDLLGVKGDYAAVAARENLLDPQTWRWTPSDLRFLEFLKNAHAQGFRVIIDGVFNHVGTLHPAFRDVVERRTASAYARWFDVTLWAPLRYNGWWGHRELPVFKKKGDNLAADTLREHIFAITRRWLAPNGDPSAGVDGWRLDVPNELPLGFWRQWCTLVRSIKPQAYITGEIWTRAEAWLDGCHFDAVMNYQFAEAVVAWLFNRKHRITAGEFDRRLGELRCIYPVGCTRVMQNLLNSHDTDRLVSMAHNPDRPYNKLNRPQEPGVAYDNQKPPAAAYARARLAAFIQMTYVGAPMIYYGDEVGMWGASDPTCRKPMLWRDHQPYAHPEQNQVMDEQLAYYRRIIALRNLHPALRIGSFQTLSADDAANVWAFQRATAEEQLLVLVNAADVPRRVRLPLPPASPRAWTEIHGPGIHGQHDPTETYSRTEICGGTGICGQTAAYHVNAGALTLEVPPLSGVVLQAHDELHRDGRVRDGQVPDSAA